MPIKVVKSCEDVPYTGAGSLDQPGLYILASTSIYSDVKYRSTYLNDCCPFFMPEIMTCGDTNECDQYGY